MRELVEAVWGIFSADDGTLSTTQTITLDVAPVNDAPDVFGIQGGVNSLQFDGVDDLVRIADTSSLNSFATSDELTVELWFKPDISAGLPQTLIAKRGPSNDSGFVLELYDNGGTPTLAAHIFTSGSDGASAGTAKTVTATVTDGALGWLVDWTCSHWCVRLVSTRWVFVVPSFVGCWAW